MRYFGYKRKGEAGLIPNVISLNTLDEDIETFIGHFRLTHRKRGDRMKAYSYICISIGILLLMATGCSSEVAVEGKNISIEKRVGEEHEYEHFKEITDNETAQEVGDLLDSVRWETTEVTMDSYPDYEFYFYESVVQPQLAYSLWISPGNDKVELVINGESKYAQLSKRKSEKLFRLITGQQLSNVSSN